MGAVPYGYGQAPFAGYAGPEMAMASPLDAEIQVVLREIHTELQTLESSGEYGEQFKNARRLLATEANKLENNIDPEWLEVDINKPIKVTKKVLIPSFRYPKFNFVGKVLGPKGATLQNIAKQYKCHVYILGRGSTRDRQKEQELLGSGDPQFAHYGGPLHVKIETTAAPALAYQRVAGVLQILSELLIPVKDTSIDGITLGGMEGDEGGNKEDNIDTKPDMESGADSTGNGVDSFNSSGGGPMKGNSQGRGMGMRAPFAPRGMRGMRPPGMRPFAPRGGRGGMFRGPRPSRPGFQPY